MPQDPETEEGFDLQSLIFRFRWQSLFILIGLAFLGLGFLYSQKILFSSPEVEIIKTEENSKGGAIVVEVSGAVEKPGVYEFAQSSRIEDALIAAGGVSVDADRNWMERLLNRAAKLVDGQKIYIPRQGEQETSAVLSAATQVKDNLVNINSASLSELDTLPGIGPVYGQSIIDHRPYSNVEELYEKGVLKENVYEKIKDKVTIY